jgi:DNA-binding response OmpR family regulator
MTNARTDCHKILLVEPDPRLLEMLVQSVVHRFDAHLTCVSSGEDALDIEVLEPHDIVVSELRLPMLDGITLTRHLMELRDRPVILLAEEPSCSEAVDALRLGARDFFPKPFGLPELMASMERHLHQMRKSNRAAARHTRMRQLVRNLIQQRRELKDRIDLVCRDLVGAHRRLLDRVLQNSTSSPIKN